MIPCFSIASSRFSLLALSNSTCLYSFVFSSAICAPNSIVLYITSSLGFNLSQSVSLVLKFKLCSNAVYGSKLIFGAWL
jgi:hypothetical protein